MWRPALSVARIAVIALALVAALGLSAAAYRLGTQQGARECVSRQVSVLRGELQREREAREADQRAAAAHAAQLEQIRARYDQARRQLDSVRREDADCDAYLARPEHHCAREYLYSLPGGAGSGGDRAP